MCKTEDSEYAEYNQVVVTLFWIAQVVVSIWKQNFNVFL